MAPHLAHKEYDEARQVSADGWMTRSVGQYMFFMGTPPPRRYRYWDQIREDLTSLEIYRFYAVFLGLTAILLVAGLYVIGAAIAVCFLSHYAFLLHMQVRSMRECSVIHGWISDFRDHPLTHRKLFEKLRAATAILDDLTEGDVVFDMPEMVDLLLQGKRLEVLMEYHNPKPGSYLRVLAYRVAPSDELENPPPVGDGGEG